jgi:hypothetical protein
LSKYTHGQHLPVEIYTRSAFPLVNITLRFLVSFAEWALGIIFLAILPFLVVVGGTGSCSHPQKKSTADITHPHTTTPSKTSHMAAWWQLGGSRQLGMSI